MKDTNLIIDGFAGGGGVSVGIEMALGRQVDIAVNHDPDAILMHKTNHPDILERCPYMQWIGKNCRKQESVTKYHKNVLGLVSLLWSITDVEQAKV